MNYLQLDDIKCTLLRYSTTKSTEHRDLNTEIRGHLRGLSNNSKNFQAVIICIWRA